MHNHLLMFSISRVLKASRDVFLGQIGEVMQDIVFGHAGCQVLEHVVDGDAHAPDARFAAALARFDRDDVPVTFHDPNLPLTLPAVHLFARRRMCQVAGFGFQVTAGWNKTPCLN